MAGGGRKLLVLSKTKKTCRTNVMYLSEHYMKTSCMINAMDKKQRV